MDKLMVLRKTNPAGFFSSVRKIIEEMTEVSSDHMTPELKFHLITPNCSLWKGDHRLCKVTDPFWAFYWPGGQALTRYLINNSDLIRDKHVLDFGSGCGSLAIATALLGKAASVTANDVDPVAAVAIELNTHLNNCVRNSMDIVTENFLLKPELFQKYNCILLGDMFYNEQFSEVLMERLVFSVENGSQIYIGDPGRHSKFSNNYRHIVEKVAVYEVTEKFMKMNDLTKSTIDIWKMSLK